MIRSRQRVSKRALRLLGDTKREASVPEVKGLRDENDRLTRALADPEKSPRELAWQETDRTGHFISESGVYRILKAHDLITSPAYVLIRAGGCFQHPTRRPNELWQTDFTYLRVVSWGWYYLSTLRERGRRRESTRCGACTDLDCGATTAPATSRAI